MSEKEENDTTSDNRDIPPVLSLSSTTNYSTDNNHNKNNPITHTVPVHLVPVNLAQPTVLMQHSQPLQYAPFTSQQNMAQPSIIQASNLVPITMQQPYIAPNPTFTMPPPGAVALHALQQSLQTRHTVDIVSPTHSNNQALPKPVIPQQHTLLCYQQAPKAPYLPPLPPQTRKCEILNENWSTKMAYAATLSSIINETAKLYRDKAELQLRPKWSDLLYKITVSGNKTTAENESSKQEVYDQAIDYIFKKSEIFLMEISSIMSETKITESIGMMKGLTDSVCNLIKIASIHLSGCNVMRMRHLFENKLLIMWCSLLLRATTDVREAIQRYLKHPSFKPYFRHQTALKSEFYKHLSSDEKLLVYLRTDKEQHDFEANTRKYVEEANLSLIAVRKISVLPQPDRMRKLNHKRQNDDLNLPKPAKKRRKKSRYQLFRGDGTPRKRQQNPCDRRICKRMWQSDGVTRGCSQNSHPRGVCPCWKKRKFSKADEKNGNILKWLETQYGKKYVL